MDLQPLGDRVIVEALEEEETTSSGIVLPDTAKEKPQRGRVLAVGPGARNDKGEIIPMEVAVGDEVIYSKYGGTRSRSGPTKFSSSASRTCSRRSQPRAPSRAKKQLAGATA